MANESCHFLKCSKFCNFKMKEYFKYEILIAMNLFITKMHKIYSFKIEKNKSNYVNQNLVNLFFKK